MSLLGLVLWYVCCVCVVIVLFNQLTKIRCYCGKCLIGKTVLVTGGNSGIGYQVAVRMASRGARVVIAARSNLETAKSRLIKETRNQNIDAMYLDLSSFESVRQFAKQFAESEKQLHILVNNAGVGTTQTNRTADGFSPVMQTNHFGAFLLTHLLVDLLKASSPSRIIFTSSCLAYFSRLSPSNLDSAHYNCNSMYSTFNEYANSKLCNIITAKVFGKRLAPFGITANALHPGVIWTPIFGKVFNDIGYSISSVLFNLAVLLVCKSVKDGADTTMHLALCDDLEQSSGHFYWDCMSVFVPVRARSDLFCDRIWRESEKIVRLREEEKI